MHAWLPTVFGMAAADSGAIQTFHWAAFAVFVVGLLVGLIRKGRENYDSVRNFVS